MRKRQRCDLERKVWLWGGKGVSVFVAAVLLLRAFSAQARWLSKSESGSVVEKFLVDIDVKRSGAWSETVDYGVRVQAEDAKTSASLFNIEYNSFTDKVEILEAYTLNGKTKVPVEAAAIEDRDKGEAKAYDAMKVRSVVFPQVQIGSRLFIKYRLTTAKPIIENRWSDDLTIGPNTFVEEFKMNVSSERPLFYEMKDPRGLLKIKQADKLHLQLHNGKILPGWVQAEKEPYFHPDSQTHLWISTETEWPAFMATLNEDYEKIQKAGVPPKLKPWIKEAAKKKTAEEKILFLMEKMSHEFRYFGDWRRHNGGLVPRTLSEIEKSRYGDCKDLASLLTALLRELHLEAYVALVRRGINPWGHEPGYKIPASGRFNHAIVQVRLQDRALWLDATNPVASVKPFSDISGRPAWILDPKGARFDRLPDPVPADFELANEYEYRFRSPETVSVRVNAWFKEQAPFHLANELMMMPRAEVLANTLDFFSEGQEIKSFHYVKEPQTGRTLRDMQMVLDYEAGRVTYNAGKDSFFVIPDGLLSGPFYETETRESDLKLSEQPFTFRGVRRLKDSRLVQEMPSPCKIESEWMTIDKAVKTDGNDILIVGRMDLKKPYITKAEFRSKAFRQLQAETKRCFYRSGILVSTRK